MMFCVTAAFAPGAGAAPDSCRDCHKDPKFRIQNRKIFDYFKEWEGSAHDLAGVGCTDCHGGHAELSTIKEAHSGILPQSDPASPVNYKNIPKTCGLCHSSILQRFSKSRHYTLLESTGKGPSCITCHGSLNAKTYYTTIISRACSTCHNEESKNRPEIIAQATDILSRLNHANGYRHGLEFYYASINKAGAMDSVNSVYKEVVRSWHEFDFKTLDERSKELVAELKGLYVQAQKERKAAEREREKEKGGAQD